MAKKIIVVGGGPAGIEAARAAALAGARVTLVSDEPIGGRAGWHSLLPSKVWLTAADTLGLMAESPALADPVQENLGPDPAGILAHIKTVKDSWNMQQADQLKLLGVGLIAGVASFGSDRRLVIKDAGGTVVEELEGDATVLATGSVPIFPPNLRPDGKRILAPRFASHLEELPERIVVIGAGPTGCEFAYLFNRLGVEVTWIVDQYGVLPAFAPATGRFLANTLAARGVKMAWSQLAERVEPEGEGVAVVTSGGGRYQADIAFVAIGRRPDVNRLNIEAVELTQLPAVDEYCRTEAPGIYAVGDVTGAPMVANRAMAQAWVAGRHAAGAKTAPFRPETVIYAVYTEPQVAQVGAAAGDGIETTRLPFSAGLKAHLLPEEAGFVELAYDPDRRVVGSFAVGPHAADVLAPVALAIQTGATLDDLASIYAAHPAISELAFAAARMAERAVGELRE